jgi:mRNA interferase MazF
MASSLAVGDVISAGFPVHDPSGREQQGYRPAVVVGVPDVVGTPRFPVVILAPLTTDRGQRWAERSPRLYPKLRRGAANLRSDSICLLDQIRSLGMERLHGYRGTLSETEYRPINDGLRQILHP